MAGSTRARWTTSALAALVVALAGVAARAQEVPPSPPPADAHVDAFDAVRPILTSKCALPGCHVGPDAAMGLRLESDRIYRQTVNVPSRTDRPTLLVAPGAPERSLLYLKLLTPEQGHYPGPRMPYGMDPLAEDAIALVREWIASFPEEQWGPPPAAEPGARAPRSFQDSHLINLPTTDTLGQNTMEFRIVHRFKASASDSGGQNLYGLDTGSFTSIGLAWGATPRVDVGLRRTNVQPVGPDFELYSRWAMIRQKPEGSPVSLALQASGTHISDDATPNGDRWTAQAILARRFGDPLSLMIVPTYVARADNTDAADDSGSFAVGVGGEWRLNARSAVTAEWVYQASGPKNPFQGGSIAWSVATARHVFAIVLSNTASAHTDLYAPGGDLEWEKGDFRLGFNITRTWSPVGP